MISKQHKLTTKEVNYLLRRRQAIYVWWYKILHCDQYTNHTYHQTGIQVSGKIHKHAVQRNIIRRAYYAAREELVDKAVWNHYHKVFLMMHPEHCEEINMLIEDEKKQKEVKRSKNINNKKDSKHQVWLQHCEVKKSDKKLNAHQQIKQHFSTIITTALWKINQQVSKNSGNNERRSGSNYPWNPKITSPKT